MNLTVLALLIFVATMALVVSAIYFFIEAPAAKKRLRARLETAKALYPQDASQPDAGLLRTEVLSGIPFLHDLLSQIPGMRGLGLFIQQAAVDITAGMLCMISILTGLFVCLACLMMEMHVAVALLAGILAGSVPFVIIGIRRQRRFLKFEEQFPDAMDLLARAVRAGHAFTTGLDLIARELPVPICQEFARAYEQQNMGLPLRDALQNMARRVPLTDVRIFITALMIQRESGGNLAEIMDNLAHVIRERFKVMRQARVYTAQGRMSLYLLLGVAPFMGVVMFLSNPDYIMLLFTDPQGIKMLITAILLQVFGYFVIRKIIQPKF